MLTDKKKEQENELHGELIDIEYELMGKIESLVDAEWEAPILKQKIEELIKQRRTLHREMDNAGYFDD